jgi:hypothetical protein
VTAWRAFFGELRRLGCVEGENLTIERLEIMKEALPSTVTVAFLGMRDGRKATDIME